MFYRRRPTSGRDRAGAGADLLPRAVTATGAAWPRAGGGTGARRRIRGTARLQVAASDGIHRAADRPSPLCYHAGMNLVAIAAAVGAAILAGISALQGETGVAGLLGFAAVGLWLARDWLKPMK